MNLRKKLRNISKNCTIKNDFLKLFYTNKYVDKEEIVYAIGSTKSTTRLFRIEITNYLEEIKEDFEVFGEIENG
ncbi:DUF6934 family protein [Neptunitalea chrysea]|uniref:DUF6934 family protein n=1 Tax=Neptunitalea chrysea TaxID=1647581 RepID=UPI0035A252DD